jgi:Tfp pilus assembly protein PilV
MAGKYKINCKNKKEKGIALVEVIAALGIAVIVITSLVALSLSTMRASLRSKLLLEGSKMANREIELVRAYRDGNTWEDFMKLVNDCNLTVCSMVVNGSGYNKNSTDEGSGTEKITRSFTAVDNGGIVRVSVSVVWTVGSESHGAYIQTDLTNWRAR